MMRRVFLSVLLVLAAFFSNAQSDTALASLEKRLSEYMIINQQLDFEKLFDYIHPNIYKIAPRAQMVEAFKKAYNSVEMNIRIDSIRKNKIGENFTLNGGSYRKVDYYMVLSLKFTNEAMMEDSSVADAMLTQFQEAMAGKVVTYDKAKKTFVIKGDDKLIAIKDKPASLWMFLSYEKGNPYASKILPKEVIDHFGLDNK